jgi:DNA-binding NarL/FixJ family response regulator
MSMKIAVYCCNALFGEGIKCILSDDPSLEVSNFSDPTTIGDAKPDLVIADLRTVGAIPLSQLFEQETMLLLLEISGLSKIEEESVSSFISKGLVGILHPNTDIPNLKKAIKSVFSGELWIERKKLRNLISENNLRSKESSLLTAKEMTIVKMVCKGYRNKEIMLDLNVSEQAVKSHLHRIFRKLGVADRLQLALHVMKNHPDYLCR